MHPIAALLELDRPIHIVDVGANPVDGTPPYASLLAAGPVKLVGFEPQPEALDRLNRSKGPYETYLPDAVGDGRPIRFHRCRSPGMSSALEPNAELLSYFHGFAQWAEITETLSLDTVRLDDVPAAAGLDYLKMDVQGSEAAVLAGAAGTLRDAVVVQTEVSFLPVYRDEPQFADIDKRLRALGFLPHAFAALNRRAFAPAVIDGSIYHGLNQVFQADMVYVRDFRAFESLPSARLKALAVIAHVCYGSTDLAQLAVRAHDRAHGSRYWSAYMKAAGLEALHSHANVTTDL